MKVTTDYWAALFGGTDYNAVEGPRPFEHKCARAIDKWDLFSAVFLDENFTLMWGHTC